MCPLCIAPNGVSLSRMLKNGNACRGIVTEREMSLSKCLCFGKKLVKAATFPYVFRFNCLGDLNWRSLHTCLKWCPTLKVSLSSIHYLKCPFAKVKKTDLFTTSQTFPNKKSMQKNQVQCGFCLHVPLILQRYWFQLQFSQLLGTFGVRSRCEWYRAGQRLWFGECFGKAVGMFAFGLHPFLGWKKTTGEFKFLLEAFDWKKWEGLKFWCWDWLCSMCS